MIRKTLFIIYLLTLTLAANNRIKGTTRQAPEPSVRVSGEFDQQQLEDLKTVLTHQNGKLFSDYQFDLVKSADNYKLILDLAYLKHSNNPLNKAVKMYFKFRLHSELLDMNCDFDFSVFTIKDIVKNDSFLESMKACNEKLVKVDVVGNNAVFEIQPVITLEEPVIFVEGPVIEYESAEIRYFDEQDETNVKNAIETLNPEFHKKYPYVIENGIFKSHTANYIKLNPLNKSQSDTLCTYKFEIYDSELHNYCHFEFEFFGTQTDLSQVSELAEKIKVCQTNLDARVVPKIETYYHLSEPLVMAGDNEFLPIESEHQKVVHDTVAIPENGSIVGAPKTCSPQQSAEFRNRYTQLLNNGVLRGMLYTENIKKCLIQTLRGDVFKTILKFDGQECYFHLYAVDNQNYIMDHLVERDGDLIIAGSQPSEGMHNCLELLGTKRLQKVLSEQRQ